MERYRQADYERRLAEPERRRQEIELQQRRDAERGRHSMFDAGVQDLFDMIYGSDARLRARSIIHVARDCTGTIRGFLMSE